MEVAPTPQPVSLAVVQTPQQLFTVSELKAIVHRKFGYGLVGEQAECIVTHESGWNPEAISPPNTKGTVDKGMWQINSIHGLPDSYTMNPVDATDWARMMYEQQEWRPWVARKHCRHLGIWY